MCTIPFSIIQHLFPEKTTIPRTTAIGPTKLFNFPLIFLCIIDTTIIENGCNRPKWFGLQPPNNLGSGHAKISDMWILICFTTYSYRSNYTIKTTNFCVFCICQYFSSLSTKHNGRHNHHNHGHHQRKWPPSTPHEALRSVPMHWMDGRQPSELADVFGGGWGCAWPSKHSFVPAMMLHHNIGVFWGPYTPSTAPKIISACLGRCRPSIRCIGLEHKASCGALGGPAAAMVCYGCVGWCWLLEADVRSTYCRNSNNCWQKYFF